MTASPQRLRLMLIEGALRFGRRAQQLWDGPTHGEASLDLVRCIAVVTELLASVKREHSPVAQQTADIYDFVLRQLLGCRQSRDVTGLTDVMRILEVDRATWHTLCQEQIEQPSGHSRNLHSPEVTARGTRAIPLGSSLSENSAASPESRLCLEA